MSARDRQIATRRQRTDWRASHVLQLVNQGHLPVPATGVASLAERTWCDDPTLTAIVRDYDARLTGDTKAPIPYEIDDVASGGSSALSPRPDLPWSELEAPRDACDAALT